MFKNKKIISIAISIMLCFMVCSFSVFATETEEIISSETTSSELTTEQEYYEENTDSETVVESEEIEETEETENTEITQEETIEPTEESYHLEETEVYQEYYEDPENYVSGEIETISVITDVDTNTLTDTDWEQISLELEKNSSKGSKNYGDDFSFIKDNNDKQNNGTWIIVVGVLLVFLSVCSLFSVVLLTKKIKFVKNIPIRQRTNTRTADDYGDNYSNNRNNTYKGKH